MERIKKGLCTPDERKRCERDFPGTLDTVCESCNKSPKGISPYTWKLIHIYNMQQGGYPFDGEDLEIEEWSDMAKVRQAFEPPAFCPFMRKKDD